MKRVVVGLWLIVSLIAIGVIILYFSSVKAQPEPKKLVVKFIFGRQGKGLGEFMYPFSLAIKDNYLFVADSGNSRIQVLKINPDGNLSPKLAFGRQGKGLGEFGGQAGYLTALAIKDNYLYVADTGNQRIQVLEIKY
jgi:DNA-binding beta-propeller fold protein YncE